MSYILANPKPEIISSFHRFIQYLFQNCNKSRVYGTFSFQITSLVYSYLLHHLHWENDLQKVPIISFFFPGQNFAGKTNSATKFLYSTHLFVMYPLVNCTYIVTPDITLNSKNVIISECYYLVYSFIEKNLRLQVPFLTHRKDFFPASNYLDSVVIIHHPPFMIMTVGKAMIVLPIIAHH